ncbi:MAG: PKD domain-containing protein [Verrucomicrobia bacterium]|nr:PKD domain-containing protein [Verrucomicrobiota bacterium]
MAERYDFSSAGTIFAMMFYPETTAPVNPASVLPRATWDNRGGYWFRSAWNDYTDLIVSLGTDTSQHGNAWDEADATQLNILGFGNRFAGGPGSSRDARFFSQVTVDGQARASQSARGTAEFFNVHDRGGYAIAGGGDKFAGLGVSFSRRHLLVSFADEDEVSILSTMDILRSQQLRTYAWQLNQQVSATFSGMEGGVPTFTMRGDNDAYLKGWVLYPTWGELSDGRPLTYTFQGNNSEIWVVMAMGTGSAPEAVINGDGLNAVLTLGKRSIRWNSSAQRIEEVPATESIGGFSASQTSGIAPVTVNFAPRNSDLQVVSWDFGDGALSTETHPTHTFLTGGVWPVILHQVDQSGRPLRSRHYISVHNNAPLARLTTSIDKGAAPLTVQFDASASSDPDGHALTFIWDFGDGSPVVHGPSQTTHTYSSQGTFFATVTVKDAHGGEGGAVRRIEVGNQAPIATFTHGSTAGIPPVNVTFNASGSTDPEGDALQFFGILGTELLPAEFKLPTPLPGLESLMSY